MAFVNIDKNRRQRQQETRWTRVNRLCGGLAMTENHRWPSLRLFVVFSVKRWLNSVICSLPATGISRSIYKNEKHDFLANLLDRFYSMHKKYKKDFIAVPFRRLLQLQTTCLRWIYISGPSVHREQQRFVDTMKRTSPFQNCRARHEDSLMLQEVWWRNRLIAT